MSTSTTRRVKLANLAPDFYQAMIELDRVSDTGLDPKLAHLVRIRASQINGCAYCTDMHSLDLLQFGADQQQRISLLPVWREAKKFYTEQEKAALQLTEAITLVSVDHVPDDVYEVAAQAFDEKDLARLIALIITINMWTRVGVTGKMEPGHYNPS
ncbi:carboxymuconolactone decarboxylase family protein [Kribbella solani]|uniref:carboxymuconolactone decarboxylase family protein n=1 Tax=Kribbella solani TaxID=236067 RepID=UPI0029B870D0|nr:carboxymuconolactone decarboxylase family protein [Kribbella solani]MDX2970211.1 carboxymuconolactone decarboxylase family protein [Kribbella solani]MDX3005837.1 carboxymuconolactone decarboxylase family protein [Kribbella solani]